MATTKHIARIVALRTGLPFDHVMATASNLLMGGAWNNAAHGLGNLLLALASQADPKSAASTAKHYAALVDGDGKTLGDMLEDMLRTFMERVYSPFSQFVYASRLHIYVCTPAASIATRCASGQHVERSYWEAHDSTTWREVTKREFTVMSGKLLFDIATDLDLNASVAV